MTEKPKLDMRISLGNILTATAMMLAGVGAFYNQKARTEEVHLEVMVLEARIQSMESETKRRLKSIEEKVDRLLFAGRGSRQ
ncbi:MAG: hypothetical protein AAF709_23370 [Pseudomonadota bacterium]